MKSRFFFSILLVSVLCATASFAGDGPVSVIHSRDVAPVNARKIQYDRKNVYRIYTKIRNTTCIILPENEKILDFTIGDSEWWKLQGVYNMAYVKPAKAGSVTNINLVCASGVVYSFVLEEISQNKDIPEPDYKVFVSLRGNQLLHKTTDQKPRFVESSTVKNYRDQVTALSQQLLSAQKEATSTIQQDREAFRSQYPAKLCFDYKFKTKKPFNVEVIYHDDKFTYIKCNAEETPALYEIRDGKPNLIHFQYQNDTYIIPKIMDSGYLQIGKKRMSFELKG